MSLPRYFEDPQTLHVNTTPHHAYFIPFSSTESAVKKTREFSPYFTLLNGEWDLAYFESYTHLPFLPIGKIMVTIIINIPT